MIQISKETIFPVKDYLLIEVENDQKETSSGLLLSEAGDNTLPVIGTVLKTGPKVEGYKVGSQIVFRKYSADEIKVTSAEKEDKFWLLQEEEIIAVISEEKKWKRAGNYEQIESKKGRIINKDK